MLQSFLSTPLAQIGDVLYCSPGVKAKGFTMLLHLQLREMRVGPISPLSMTSEPCSMHVIIVLLVLYHE